MDSRTMAAQLAQLLTRSDLDELRLVVAEWKAQAVTDSQRKVMDEMGGRLLDLKAALAEAPQQPTYEELEEALRMMIELAQKHGGSLL